MSFSLRFLTTILVVFFSFTASGFAQSAAQTAKVSRGSVSGRITIKDKGVAGIVVGVEHSGVPGQASACVFGNDRETTAF